MLIWSTAHNQHELLQDLHHKVKSESDTRKLLEELNDLQFRMNDLKSVYDREVTELGIPTELGAL